MFGRIPATEPPSPRERESVRIGVVGLFHLAVLKGESEFVPEPSAAKATSVSGVAASVPDVLVEVVRHARVLSLPSRFFGTLRRVLVVTVARRSP